MIPKKYSQINKAKRAIIFLILISILIIPLLNALESNEQEFYPEDYQGYLKTGSISYTHISQQERDQISQEIIKNNNLNEEKITWWNYMFGEIPIKISEATTFFLIIIIIILAIGMIFEISLKQYYSLKALISFLIPIILAKGGIILKLIDLIYSIRIFSARENLPIILLAVILLIESAIIVKIIKKAITTKTLLYS